MSAVIGKNIFDSQHELAGLHKVWLANRRSASLKLFAAEPTKKIETLLERFAQSQSTKNDLFKKLYKQCIFAIKTMSSFHLRKPEQQLIYQLHSALEKQLNYYVDLSDSNYTPLSLKVLGDSIRKKIYSEPSSAVNIAFGYSKPSCVPVPKAQSPKAQFKRNTINQIEHRVLRTAAKYKNISTKNIIFNDLSLNKILTQWNANTSLFSRIFYKATREMTRLIKEITQLNNDDLKIQSLYEATTQWLDFYPKSTKNYQLVANLKDWGASQLLDKNKGVGFQSLQEHYQHIDSFIKNPFTQQTNVTGEEDSTPLTAMKMT